jgi:hypothetical protein
MAFGRSNLSNNACAAASSACKPPVEQRIMGHDNGNASDSIRNLGFGKGKPAPCRLIGWKGRKNHEMREIHESRGEYHAKAQSRKGANKNRSRLCALALLREILWR